MKPRDQFLADCAEVWDRSDGGAVFVFGEPGSQVGLFSGPMTTHTLGPWICFHLGEADRASIDRLIRQLAPEVLQ